MFISSKMFPQEVIVVIFVLISQCYGEFVIPEVTLEAFTPKGLRASIPAIDGLQMFAFHANINKDITQVDPGQYSKDYTSPNPNNMWVYENDDITLKVGDVVHFWIFVQYQKLGYRKDAQQWKVTELLKKEDTVCQNSASVVAGKASICKDKIIFQDEFDGSGIDSSKWRVEQYIPSTGPNYEFVSYQADVCSVNNNNLFIRPKYARTENDVNGELDLRTGCTRKQSEMCYYKKESAFILPPVTSGRIISQTSFRYGKVEIKAKLPAGDWIYPQIYLEQEQDPKKTLWIAYARGNKNLLANSGDDIGNHLLFGGPVLEPKEPVRSTYLQSKRETTPFSDQMHVYTVIWSKDQISLMVDGTQYGKINADTMKQINFSENGMVRLVIGVGVGGVNDFPDDFRSGEEVKPWHNRERGQARKFFEARNIWSKTWSGDNSALQVDYVKITAL